MFRPAGLTLRVLRRERGLKPRDYILDEAWRSSLKGEFPATARTFVFKDGAIGNYSYLAIPFNAANVAGALVTVYELMSFDYALEACRTLGNTFPHRVDLLSPEQRALVEAAPSGPATLRVSDLASHFLPEPDAEYLNRLEKDWTEKVLRR